MARYILTAAALCAMAMIVVPTAAVLGGWLDAPQTIIALAAAAINVPAAIVLAVAAKLA